MLRVLLLTLILFLLALASPVAQAMDAKTLGFTLQALSAEDLDSIEENTGYRVGVIVAAVTPDSLAHKTGFRPQDILLTIGKAGVDSPAAVDKALHEQQGDLEVLLLRVEGEQFAPLKLTIRIGAGGVAPVPAPAPPADDVQEKLRALEGAHDAGILTDEEYTRKKAELLKSTPAAPDGGVLEQVTESGEVYRHPIGFQFWHPTKWKVVVAPDSPLQLVPPDVVVSEGQPMEIFVVLVQSVAGLGITRANDPQVIAYLDEQVKQLNPAFQRLDRSTPLHTSAGQGTSMDWEAPNDRGQTVRVRAYVNILNEHGVALLAIAETSLVDKRDPTLQRMFASFGFGKGKIDAALTGRWSLVSTYALSNQSVFETDYSRARMVRDTQTSITLNADGSWEKISTSQMIAGAGGVWLESKDTSTERGRWYAENGNLYLVEEKGGWAQYQYRIEEGAQGRQVKLVDGKQGEIWQGN